jgi:hypothetical protein
MISYKYAKDILNFLFCTNGSENDANFDAECRELEEAGVVLNLTGKDYFDTAIPLDDDDEATKIEKLVQADEYEKYKNIINATSWCLCTADDETSYKYRTLDSKGDLVTVEYPGYKTIALLSKRQTAKYPTARYLALFTKMPDINGNNYEEPFKTADGKTTTYCRVNLDVGYFSRQQVMGYAQPDEVNGGASIWNIETIYYPEVSGDGMAWTTEDTPIVGFGIFENRTKEANEVPYLWGLLSNGGVQAPCDKVPLFRGPIGEDKPMGDFKISIS